MPDIKEMQEQRHTLKHKLHEYHKEHSDTWSPEDDAAWSRMNGEINRLSDMIKAESKMETVVSTDGVGVLEGALEGQKKPVDETKPVEVELRHPFLLSYTKQPGSGRNTLAYRKAFRNALLGKRITDAEEQMLIPPAEDFSAPVDATDTLSSGDNERAGYLVPDEEFASGIYRTLDDAVVMRQLATVFTVRQADSLTWHRRTQKAQTFKWAAELEEPTPDQALKVGNFSLTPHYLIGEIRASNDLMRRSVMSIDAFINFEIEANLRDTLEQSYMTGDNDKKPLGLFTPSAEGISTSRDVALHNTTTAIGADHFRAVKYELRSGYRTSKARWLMHRNVLEEVSKLKTADDQYLWRPGLALGDPDTILGHSVIESEYAPSTLAAGQYIGIFGDFSKYYIVDQLRMNVMRLNELFARQNQTGWIFRLKTDGGVIDQEAFVRLTMAAS